MRIPCLGIKEHISAGREKIYKQIMQWMFMINFRTLSVEFKIPRVKIE